MADHPPILVAPDAFGGELRAPVVAAAIARGLERAGVAPPPELCPVSSGGRGTIEALLPALGGETGDGFALIEDGGTAIVRARAVARELTARAAGRGRGHRRRRWSCSRRRAAGGRGDGTARRCSPRSPTTAASAAPRSSSSATCARPVRSPCALRDEGGARLVAGAPFVLEALGFDARMRAARALVVGERRLDRATLRGRVVGEMATRARQSGVPCHAVVGDDAIDRFDARILDLQAIIEAATVAELEAAGEALAAYL